ncbi:MAG: GGDEF domain-containing protein [Nitrospirae bacterium]|nr:GGDEF domain-containing protein [Nitrospirota bacterium]
MGSPLQQIFPGRGDKKGKSYWLRGASVFLLVVAWAGLLLNYPVQFPRIWFPFAATTLVSCGALHLLARRREYAIEFLYAILLMYAGIIGISGLSWLKLAYFPFIIAMTRFYSLNIIIPLSLLIPFNALRSFTISRENIVWETAFSIFLVLTSVVASLIFNSLRSEREKAVNEFEKIRAGARDRTQDTEMESLGSDELISHYFASKIKANEEIQELLHAIKHAVFADSAHFFEPHGDTLSLRCSTDDRGKVIITGKGVMATCLKERKPFFSGEVDEKKIEVGYIKDIRILSIIAIPVMEGSSPVGLLIVDTSRYHAFSEPEQKTVKMFSGQIAKILERERVYNIVKHEITALRIIKEFSSSLAASIHYDDVINKLCHYSGQAFSGNAFFFEHDTQGFVVKYFPNEISGGAKEIDFRGTLAGLAIENGHMEYVSDVKQFVMKVLPPQFRTEDVRSVIAVPLFFEGALIGVFGMLSKQKEFLDSRQISLVEVMCNQAATSIANAKMHAEIERMATTDGLTGLFNHRVFQQKLTEELKRSERHETPLSLLLTDIDFFKKVNDTYGHPVGDLVLKGVSKILQKEIRDIDTAARYGGEEFVVILPGTDSMGAKNFAERLRKAITAETFSSEGRTLKITTSIGIATMPADARTKEELIERTDQALYHAKHNGRNQSVAWGTIR